MSQEFILRVKKKGDLEYFVGRRYGDFARLHKNLRTELPGKVLPPLPKKNKTNSMASNLISGVTGGNDSDASSISSVSTQQTGQQGAANGSVDGSYRQMLTVKGSFIQPGLLFYSC